MIVQSQLGLRCQGLYRGTVIQHLPHGRLKVFIYGVYPDEYLDHPELLPICEQITPLWGGSCNGNGSFSYPNIGSTVFVQFANEDVNQPVAIGATLGGENAYNQYNNIKAQDEEVSKKHMFTTGMAHFQMHESGKISSYVQQPFDNDVSIDFSYGDVSCEISADIAQKIEANEISHIVCQQVLDNTLGKGEISVSTHFYEPYSFTSSYFLSDTQEAIVSSLDRETSALNYGLKNNLGDIIDNEICSMTASAQYVHSNLNDQTTTLSTLDESYVASNVETTRIDSKKDILLENTVSKDIMASTINAKDSSMQLSTYSYENTAANADYNHVNGKRNVSTSNNKAEESSSMFYDNKMKLLSAATSKTDNSNGSYKNLSMNGVKDDVLQNLSTYQDTYLYANDTLKEVTVSSKNDSKLYYANDYLDNSIQASDGMLLSRRNLLSSLGDEQLFLTVSPAKTEISTLNSTIQSNIKNVSDNNAMTSEIADTCKLLSTHIDAINQSLTSYTEDITNVAQNVIDKDKNIKLNSQTDIKVLSTVVVASDVGDYQLTDVNSNQLNIDQQSIVLNSLSTHDYLETHAVAGTKISDNLTSDNKFCLNLDNTTQLKTQFTHIKNDTQISAKYFLLEGDATGHAVLELSNYEDTLNKNTKIEILADENDTAVELKAYDAMLDRECSTKMSTDQRKIDMYVKDNSAGNTLNMTMDLENEIITINADSANTCIMTFDASTGEVTVKSQKVNITAENEIVLNSKSMLTILASDQLNLTSKQMINVNGIVNVNGETNFYDKTRLLGGVDSSITVSGNVKASEFIKI